MTWISHRSVPMWHSLVVSSGIMLFAAYLLPDPEYYDESDE